MYFNNKRKSPNFTPVILHFYHICDTTPTFDIEAKNHFFEKAVWMNSYRFDITFFDHEFAFIWRQHFFYKELQ